MQLPEPSRFGRLHFLLGSLFLLTQAYTIPVLCLSSSWALWPTLTDFVICIWGVVLVAEYFVWPSRPEAKPRQVLKLFSLVTALAAVSFICLTYLAPRFHGDVYGSGKGVVFGGFMLARLAQCYVVLAGVARADCGGMNRRVWRRVATFALLVVAIAPLATRCGVADAALFAPQIPASLERAGPWGFYHSHGGAGWGTTGYNHAYTALQITLLTAMVFVDVRTGPSLVVISLVLISSLGVISSGSRMGLLAHVLYLLPLLRNYPGTGVAIVFGGLVASFMAPGDLMNEGLTDVFSRQATVLERLDSENLSGRDEIWAHYANVLYESPLNSIVGIGFGNTFSLGGGAHMLPLTIFLEGGFIGLLITAGIGLSLYRCIPATASVHRPRWLLVVLGLTCLTQETLNPVPAFGHGLAVLGFLIMGDVAQSRIEVPNKVSQQVFLPSSRPVRIAG